MSAINGCAKLHGCTRPVKPAKCFECGMNLMDLLRAKDLVGTQFTAENGRDFDEKVRAIREQMELRTEE